MTEPDGCNSACNNFAIFPLDIKQYPPKYFKDLYYLRWGIETFYSILKNRLNLENFSGYSPEAIRQDFYVTIFLSGAESILTLEAEAKLAKQKGGHPKKVNKSHSTSLKKGLLKYSMPKNPLINALDD